MIIKGGTRSGGRMLAEHLARADTNETVQLLEVRGTAATDLDGSFREMVAVASGTRCKNPLYHASINTARDERLTPEQWRHSVETLEKALGLTDQPRAVVRHVKDGREHVHVVWSRIDAEHMRAISDSNNYYRHEEVARQLEQEFGHRAVEGVHTGDKSKGRPVAEANQAEQEQAGDGRAMPVKLAKGQLTAAWDETLTGQEFADKIAEQGYTLARGDKRDFVIVDWKGGVHSPRRRIVGMKAADIEARFSDIDPADLPTVAAARAATIERGLTDQPRPVAPELPEPEKAIEKPIEPPAPPVASTAKADSDRADQAQKGTEAGVGFLERLFTKAAELFDSLREKLFGAAFAPMGYQEATPPPAQEPKKIERPAPEPVPVEVEKVAEPEKPKTRAQAKPYEPRRIPPPVKEPGRELDHAGRERSIEIDMQPPPESDDSDGE